MNCFCSRREMLRQMGTGLGMLGLASLFRDAGLLMPSARGATDTRNPLLPKSPHFPGKAKRVIHIYLNGGPSQVDTWDPKPMLEKFAGKPLPSGNLTTERPTGGLNATRGCCGRSCRRSKCL